MTTRQRRLYDMPVRRLEYVFRPNGLPLVGKAPDVEPSTTILVRGEPGTGKTTLALGLALAIAEKRRVFYITTETVPTELRFKMLALGRPETDIGPFPSLTQVEVQHVELHSDLIEEHEITHTSERKQRSIETAWTVWDDGEGQPTHGVVVLDAFGLVDIPDPARPAEGDLRLKLVRLIQSLEARGVSLIVVAEMAAPESAWLSYVVDIAFDLSFVSDEDTHQLRRTLTVKKSRFAEGIAGPHDYGMDMGVPSVWPDLPQAIRGDETGRLASPAPSIGFPYPFPTQRMLFLSKFTPIAIDATAWSELNGVGELLARTPGMRVLRVQVGHITTLVSPDRTLVPIQIESWEGPGALLWGILEVAALERVTTLIFSGAELLSEGGRYGATLVRGVNALSMLGYQPIILADKPHQTHLGSIARLTFGKEVTCRNLGPTPSPGRPVREILNRVDGFKRLHKKAFALPDAAEPRPPILERYIRHDLALGDHWAAGRGLMFAVQREDCPQALVILWWGLCALWTENEVAVQQLTQLVESKQDRDAALGLFPALGLRDRIDEIDRLAPLIAENRLALLRIRSEARLYSLTPAVRDSAIPLIEEALRLPDLPMDDHVELLINLAWAVEQAGDPVRAESLRAKVHQICPEAVIPGVDLQTG